VPAAGEAYQDFQKMRPTYKPIRRENLKKTTVKRIDTLYGKSILLSFLF